MTATLTPTINEAQGRIADATRGKTGRHVHKQWDGWHRVSLPPMTWHDQAVLADLAENPGTLRGRLSSTPKTTPQSAAEREAIELWRSKKPVGPMGNEAALAMHEAGHCRAAVAQGMRITSAELTPDGNGIVNTQLCARPLAVLRFQLAGAAAEALYCGKSPPNECLSMTDCTGAISAIEKLHGRPIANPHNSTYFKDAMSWARDLCRTRRDDLYRVAYLFSKYRKIDGRTVAAACGK